MRLGLLGGTFDPIHWGHLAVAEEARRRVALDEVVFVLAGRPWMKTGHACTAGSQRNAMVELATAAHPFFRVSTVELRRPGNTFTVETLEKLPAQVKPGTEVFFILGMDSLEGFHRWRQPQRILGLCRLVVVARPGHPEYDPSVLEGLGVGATNRVVWIDGPQVEISGTDIRQRVKEGRPIKHLVPEAVEEYIYRQGLYKDASHDRD